MIEEINARTKFPITKQDSYANAIYHGAKKVKNVRKQGEKQLVLCSKFIMLDISKVHMRLLWRVELIKILLCAEQREF